MSEVAIDCQKAAKYLGVSVKTVRRWAQAGKLQGKKVGTRGDWRFAQADLDRVVRSTALSDTYLIKITDYIHENAEGISRQVCQVHRTSYGITDDRWQFVKEAQPLYVSIMAFLVEFLTSKKMEKIVAERHSTTIAQLALKSGLTIEEITDGIIVFKRVLLENLHESGLTSRLKSNDLFTLISRIADYGDILSSQISFAYHYEFEKNREKLSQSEEKFSKVFQSGPAAFSVTHYDTGKWVDVNDRFLELTGYSREEVIGRDPLEIDLLVEDNPVGGVNERRNTLKETGSLPHYYLVFKTKDGDLRRVRGASVMVKINGEEHIVTMQLDITDLENAREGRLKYAELSTAHDILLELSRAKDEFIGIASHQLRTPATAVKQYIGMMLAEMAGPLSDQQKKFLETAYNSNERQLKLINDLLKTAQIDASAYTLHRSNQNISALLTIVAGAIEPTLSQRRQRLVFRDESDNATANIDPTEMDLVFSNLIDNASKYSHEESTITVSIKERDNEVEVSITDEGVGIDEADQPKIYDKFIRISNEMSRPNNGSGLGLYWVKHIVDMHGGSIEVQSKLGEGSTFIVRLPK